MARQQEDKGFWDNIIQNLCSVKYGCCCCCELRTGSLLIGWFYAILSTLSLITWLKEGVGLDVEVLRKTPIAGNAGPHEHFGDKITPALYCFLMVVEALASVGLLVGIHSGHLEPVKIWIEIFLISFLAGIIWETFKYGAQAFLGETSLLYFCVVLLTLLIVKPFQFWKILVVRSYYVQQIDN